jgi:hypothetical protein
MSVQGPKHLSLFKGPAYRHITGGLRGVTQKAAAPRLTIYCFAFTDWRFSLAHWLYYWPLIIDPLSTDRKGEIVAYQYKGKGGEKQMRS